jgi:DNA modification methylase
MEEFHSVMKELRAEANIMLHDARQPFPLTEPVDLMLTSPPYGDSRTTVAYGQFSRLALQWLDMWDKDIDQESLGGRRNPLKLETSNLIEALGRIEGEDNRRAEEVEAFYQDLHLCLENILKVVKPGGFAVFVIANRKVKGVILPTDKIIAEMMGPMGFSHVATYHREIPHKRMPSRNSPSNIRGQTDVTMLREHIVLLEKERFQQIRLLESQATYEPGEAKDA